MNQRIILLPLALICMSMLASNRDCLGMGRKSIRPEKKPVHTAAVVEKINLEEAMVLGTEPTIRTSAVEIVAATKQDVVTASGGEASLR